MRSTTAYEAERPLTPPRDVHLWNWPLYDDGLSAWAVVALALGTSIVTYVVGQSILMAAFCLAALALALWRLWIPVQFEFGPKGVTQTILGRTRRIPWSAVRRCEIRRAGLLLLPLADRRPLAAIRGLYIRWRGQRAELLAIMKHYLGARAPI